MYSVILIFKQFSDIFFQIPPNMHQLAPDADIGLYIYLYACLYYLYIQDTIHLVKLAIDQVQHQVVLSDQVICLTSHSHITSITDGNTTICTLMMIQVCIGSVHVFSFCRADITSVEPVAVFTPSCCWPVLQHFINFATRTSVSILVITACASACILTHRQQKWHIYSCCDKVKIYSDHMKNNSSVDKHQHVLTKLPTNVRMKVNKIATGFIANFSLMLNFSDIQAASITVKQLILSGKFNNLCYINEFTLIVDIFIISRWVEQCFGGRDKVSTSSLGAFC